MFNIARLSESVTMPYLKNLMSEFIHCHCKNGDCSLLIDFKHKFMEIDF